MHKKHVFLKIILSFVVYAVLLSGCSAKALSDSGKRWKCTVKIPANSKEIVLSDEIIQTDTGELSLQNQTGEDIIWYLYEDGGEEASYVRELAEGGAATQYQLEKDVDYRIGIQADIAEEKELTVVISEKPNGEPYYQ